MAEIRHEIKISGTPQQVYDALTTVDGLRAWHTPLAEGTGDVGTEWVFRFTGRPEFVWAITESVPASAVAWRCAGGPGDSPGTTVTFGLEPLDDGRTQVELTHAGWPGTHGNFRKCNTIWAVLLHHLGQYVETSQPATAFE